MKIKKKIIFLSSGKNHHKYLIKFLEKKKFNFNFIFFDKKKISPPFDVGLTEKKKQYLFEKKNVKNYITKPKPKIIYDINSNKFILDLKKNKPDLGVVFGTRKLSNKLIRIFKDGVINIHRGYIQEYRGLDSEYWALYHKDYKKIGATLHYINEDLDSGDIISQKFLRINKKIKIFKLRYLTTKLGAELLNSFLKKYLSLKKIKKLRQIKIGRYYSFIPKVILKQIEKKYI
jgi:methionyl-tRNA formyltransferase